MATVCTTIYVLVLKGDECGRMREKGNTEKYEMMGLVRAFRSTKADERMLAIGLDLISLAIHHHYYPTAMTIGFSDHLFHHFGSPWSLPLRPIRLFPRELVAHPPLLHVSSLVIVMVIMIIGVIWIFWIAAADGVAGREVLAV